MQRRRVAAAAIASLDGLVGFASGAVAAKPSAATLTVSFSTQGQTTSASTMPYATPYTVSGCGHSAALGGVTVVVHSPEAVSFAGQMPDANGCISVSIFSTQGPGSYTVDAYQQVRNKSSVVAETSFT